MPLIQRVTLVVLSQFKEGQQNLFLKVTTNIWSQATCSGRTCKAVRKHSNRLPKHNEFNVDDRCQLSLLDYSPLKSRKNHMMK